MAKQRNSLGLLVLPIPSNETLTWDEYKERTGIDLDKLLKIENIGTGDSPEYQVSVRETCRKIIVISCSEGDSAGLPPVMIPSKIDYVANASLSSSNISFSCVDADNGFGYYILMYANKTVFGGAI